MRAMSAMPRVRAIAREPVSRRTWRETAYAVVSLLPAIPAFVLALLGIVTSVLSIVVVGLPALAGVLLGVRSCAALFRRPARAILGWHWPPPQPPPPADR